MKNMILEGFDGRRQAFARHAARHGTVFGIQPGDTLLVLGDETRGIVVTRPEVMRDVAARIFDESDE